MPKLGDITVNEARQRCIWHACQKCGKERWVRLFKDAPVSLKCRDCGTFKNGQIIANGYVYILCKEHPKAGKWGYVKRARLVLEEKLGRYLLPGMIPHHINHIRDDDRPENLKEELLSKHIANIHCKS